MNRLILFAAVMLLTAGSPTRPNAERIGVVVTAWGEPDGFKQALGVFALAVPS